MIGRMRMGSAAVAAVTLLAGGCGGGSTTSPSPVPTPVPTTSACDPLGGKAGLTAGILNGAACSTANSPVVLLNLRGADGFSAGACSGTVIGPRAVLTAAHCLDGDTASVKVWRGVGEEIAGASFYVNPRYRENDSLCDVGVVLTDQDINRPSVGLLISRDVRVGEQAVIAGWGRDEFDQSRTLRAGSVSITGLADSLIQTRYGGTGSGAGVCAGDSGGPILVKEGETWVVAGVTSAISSSLCASGTSYYAALHQADNRVFVLTHVPGATVR